MTVAELIEELKKQPQWALVTDKNADEIEKIDIANISGTVVRLHAG